MKLLKVGVYHHDCWGSESTQNFPTLSMTELGAVRIVRKDDHGVLVDCCWRITADTEKEVSDYLRYVKSLPSTKQFKLFLQNGNRAYIFMQFLSKTSSYDSVLSMHGIPVGPIVQEREHEIHTIATEKPRETSKLLSDLEALGEVKVYKISDFKEDAVFSTLTLKQQDALLTAVNNQYYSWPRKLNLDDISQKIGVKRRTFQERLRQAEAKFIPGCIDKLIKEKRF
ncbi:MAG: helix-turn-helix domain-containing protein [Nanoarchaeota archaeon]|nr:helix-turn-helix domain-containing protein [Nanoarchaeota archaeon]